MLRHIFYGAPRTWLRATLALGLGLGCLWGSLQGVHIAVQQGYVQLSVLTVALNTLQSQLNTTLFAAVFVSFLSSLVFAVCYVVLTMLRFPPRSADVGAGAWMAAILLCPAVGYGINQTHWFPPFWSIGGVLGNALVVSLFLLLGFAGWLYLRRMRDNLDAPLQRLGWVLSIRVIGGFALYWLTINVAFYGVNAYASSLVGAEQPPRLKVVVIGLDAATWKVMDPLLQQGRLPNLRRLMESGTYGPLTTLEPTLSPIIWTTIATGKPMSAHGITHFIVQKEGPEQGTLATSDMRQVKALWNILSERKRSVGVVNWFVTWPAEAVNGFIVSSYAGLGRTWKGSLRKGIPQQTYPEELIQELEPLMEQVEAALEERSRQIFPRIDTDRLTETQRVVVEDSRQVLLADMLSASVGLHLLQKRSPEFFALYLGGIDVFGHRFWKYMHPRALPYKVTPEQIAMFGDVLANYYMLTDELVGGIVAASDEHTLIMVISDHGMDPHIPRDGNDDRSSAEHGHAPPGIIIVSGKPVQRGPLPVPASVFDIAPTLLYALDLPLAADMVGRPILAAFSKEFLQRHPPVYVRSYEDAGGQKDGAVARKSEVDDLLKKRLKSLGYIK